MKETIKRKRRFTKCPRCGYEDIYELEVEDTIEQVYKTRWDCSIWRG